MNSEQVLILTGIGGQGIQVAGKTLARAAVYEQKRALYFSLFDGAQRGGVSDCTVVISDEAIQAPPLMKQPCDALMAMDPNGLMRYQAMVRRGGVIVYNRSIHEVSRFRYADMHNEEVVNEARPTRENVEAFALAATTIAKEKLDAPLMASLICLGALIQRTGVVRIESAQQALFESIRPGRQKLVAVSARALEIGAAISLGNDAVSVGLTGATS